MYPAPTRTRVARRWGVLGLSIAVAAGAVVLARPEVMGVLYVPDTTAAPAGLAAAAVAAAQGATGPATELGVAVLDRATGEIATGRLGEQPFYAASVAKLVVAADVLDRRRSDGLAVGDADLELVRHALGPSDDNAMNQLWTRFDGPGAAGRTAVRLGLTGTGGPSARSQWGEMLAPAVDVVRIWAHVLDELPAADRDTLLVPMNTAPPRAADGFDQQFGLRSTTVDGPGAPGAIAKQGWMCCVSDMYYLHSTGVVGQDQRFVIALLTRMPRGEGWTAARGELDTIAAAAVDALHPTRLS
ncbi:hypothetical protein [Pseudonocardia sp. TRM90224]|uniref:hypothetical protein n=1 Tax=Pseudonocardia sp. TRM90224 TaxID=2812678 RepID=UPI001E3E6D84|nr:hypothetical protein [Pseudonocardia sp. TRM90224]